MFEELQLLHKNLWLPVNHYLSWHLCLQCLSKSAALSLSWTTTSVSTITDTILKMSQQMELESRAAFAIRTKTVEWCAMTDYGLSNLYLTLLEDIFVALWFRIFLACINNNETDLSGATAICFTLYLLIYIPPDWRENSAMTIQTATALCTTSHNFW